MAIVRKSQQTGLSKEIVQHVQEVIDQAWSSSTKRVYRSLWDRWVEWCSAKRTTIQASESKIMAFLAEMQRDGSAISTMRSCLTAIRHAHDMISQLDTLPPWSSKMKAFLRGLSRKSRNNKPKQKAPMTVELLWESLEKAYLEEWEKALVLWAFLTGFRRSEIVSLRLRQVETRSGGLIVHLDHSKTNQEGKEEWISIPKEARGFDAISLWLSQRLIDARSKEEYLFPSRRKDGHISEKTLVRLVKKLAESLGRSPDDFAGHSLRSGLATSLAEKGQDVLEIANHLRHVDAYRTTRKYVRRAKAFDANPLKSL